MNVYASPPSNLTTTKCLVPRARAGYTCKCRVQGLMQQAVHWHVHEHWALGTRARGTSGKLLDVNTGHFRNRILAWPPDSQPISSPSSSRQR